MTFNLMLTRHPPGVAAFELPSAFASDLSGNVPPHILRDRHLAKMALLRETIYKRLTVALKRCDYDYEKRVCKTSVSKTNELLFVDRPPLAVSTNSSKTMDKPTCNKLIRKED